MKRFISALLAACMVLSMTACGQDGASSDVQSGQDSTTSAVENAPAEPAPEESKPLSNPVAMDENGDVDMEKALAYETDIDAFVAAMEAKTIDPTMPVSENSNENTMEVWNYLRSIYGKQMISAQQMKGGKSAEDLVYYNATGDLPAMKGFDFIFCTGGYHDEGMIDEAIEWHHESGGLVTFTWHWNVPRDVDDPDKGWAFYQEEIINWSQINAVTPGTKEYETVIHDIDLIASKLQRLEAEGVTVLFRPLHEASGAWFWWGTLNRASAENQVFQKLWYMIYDRLENYHKLTNLIWVWNGQSKNTMVSPNTYDIAGIDYYADKEDHSSLPDQYRKLNSFNADSGKMLTLSECGYIPDPADCVANGNMWLYYMTWNGDFVYEATPGGAAITDFNGTPSPNPERMTNEMLVEYFGNDAMITFNDLPTKKEIPQDIRNWEFFKVD